MAQPIRKFSSKKSLSKSELAEFRNYVSQLKKRGVITGKISARVSRPAFVRNGETLAEIVNKHSESLTPFKSAASTTRSISVSKPITSKAKLNPLRQSISVRDFPHTHKSLAGILQDLTNNAKEIDKLKKPNERWAFEIDGTSSLAPFRTIDQLVEWLTESAGIQQIFHKRQKSQEIFNSLKIIRWNGTTTQWEAQRKVRGKLRKRKGYQARKRRK